MNNNISSIVVFFQGMASFLSPCILPLMPIYLSYLTGGSLEDIEAGAQRKAILINSLGFLLGLSLVFTMLGATATALGRFLLFNNNIIRKVGGIVVIVFGIHHIGIINLNFLNMERKFRFHGKTPKFINSVILGMAFSFGWSPCIGPILGSVLMMAANLENYVKGIYLLMVYSLGFSVPFIITAMFLNIILQRITNLDRYLKIIKVVSGILLIIMGILVYTNKINMISSIFS
ncbi:MAG: cytochrome c biogenesis protein CcdA [Clostridia bacterium]|nr:cytochrome c biogenesis protein CcdA [Clostridia bacterium]